MSTRRVTMADVARRAGVSKTAVSFAFNDPARLSDATRRQILAVAEELGYTRDPAARMLRTGRTNSLGLILPQPIDVIFSNPYYTQFLRGIGQTCRQEGMSLLLVPPMRGSLAKAIPYAAADGFVLSGLDAEGEEVRDLRNRGVPFVLVDSARNRSVPWVGIDERAAMRAMGHYLAERGHRRIAVLAFEPGSAGPAARRQGSLGTRLAGLGEALADHGVDLDDLPVLEVACTREAGAEGFRRLWDGEARPTAVVTFADVIALGVLDAAHELGVAVPAQVSVTGFDDLPEAAVARPTLTTVRQPIVSKGRLAAEYLIDAIADPAARHPQHRRLHTDIVARRSVLPVAEQD